MAKNPNYVLAARRAAKRHGVDPDVMERQIRQESGFNKNARSPAGAQGIAQFMPATAKQYGVNLGDGKAADDLDGAARMMAAALKAHGGDYKAALSVYNSGRPDGYKHIAETKNYVNAILGGKTPKSKAPSVGSGTTTTSRVVTKTTPASTKTDTDSAIVDALLAHPGKKGLMARIAFGLDSGQYTTTTPAKTSTQKVIDRATKVAADAKAKTAAGPSTHSKGTVDFEGHKVAAWIAPALKYARKNGWTGSINSGYRSFEDQTRIWNSGVRPAAKPGTSNHEGSDFPRGAIDVNGAAQLSKILSKSQYKSLLVWAGAKDPVHFSHPHGGSY